MPKSIDARLTSAEKKLGAPGQRRGYSLSQLLMMAREGDGYDSGAPEAILKDGELSVGELILAGSTGAQQRGQ